MRDKFTDEVYLKHILDAIAEIEKYLAGFKIDSFIDDSKTSSAVLYQLEIIGEASNKLSDLFKKAHPEIPFRSMTDMRNVVAHEYFGIHLKTVWRACQNDIPPLKTNILKILEK